MLLIKGGKVFGAETNPSDILLKDGKIASIAENIEQTSEMTVIDASGKTAAPGFVDLHVHFREPGFEYKEDIRTGSAAAAAGGVTTCLCMPNTYPKADNFTTISLIAEKGKNASVRVLPVGAVTIGQNGEQLTDFKALKKAGAKALSDDGNPIQSAEIARRAMQEAKKLDMVIISHCEDEKMVRNYAVNEGRVSEALGLPGRPASAEDIMVARDVLLAQETGAKVHIAHISTATSVAIIRYAKKHGIPVTAETCPQYFSLTEEAIFSHGTLARVNPPLRTANDVDAIIEGLADGTIDAIATDHAPHSEKEKALPIEDAPSGMIGLETSLAVAVTYLYHTGKLPMDKIIKLMSTNPARIFGIDGGTLQVGSRADVVIFDPYEKWQVQPSDFRSKARNTPYAQMELFGKVKYTMVQGEIVYREK